MPRAFSVRIMGRAADGKTLEAIHKDLDRPSEKAKR